MNLTKTLVQNTPAPLRTAARSASQAASTRSLRSEEAQRSVLNMTPQPSAAQQLSTPVRVPVALPMSISVSTLVQRFGKELATTDEIEALRKAITEAQAEQHLAEQSSVSLRQDNLSAARRAVTMDCSDANVQRLRDLNQLTDHDLYALQAAHHRRKDVIVAERVAPLAKVIFNRLRDLLKVKADELQAAEERTMAAFGLPHESSALLGGLRSLEREYAGLTSAASRSLCDFRHELLKALLAQAEPPPN